ncbi:MAG: type I CRISPR-associated protein Cas7, partial [Butyrivibrio sp.]|nr:type I CRISPR-associated protein Cas7 [Butyrivibrio sp.]
MSQVVKNRYEFMVLVEGKMCNPNGDPDMGNLPRQDNDTGCGYITDVAFKRRIRNYVDDGYGAEEGRAILMQSGTSINRKIAESVMKVNKLKKVPSKFINQKVPETAKDMMERYWDVRTFGAVLST